MRSILRPSLNWMFIFLPIALYFEHFQSHRHTLIFLLSSISIVPLAAFLSKATEQVADRTGEALGGFLSATMANTAEFIIAIVALRQGQIEIVKASLAGAIIGNTLLVLGIAFVAGGLRYKLQEFDVAAVHSQVSTLLITSIALIIVGIYNALANKPEHIAIVDKLSLSISIILLLVYLAYVVFSLYTHKEFFSSISRGDSNNHDDHKVPWSLGIALATLIGSAALIALMSEVMVGSMSEAAKAMGMSDVFVGVIVLAMVGSAAENSTAVVVARKNRMGLSLGIAMGSSIQIALFVAPFLVLLSYVIAPQPMNLGFTSGEGLAVILAVIILGHVVGDGRSNWFEGLQLLAVYLILALAFYFLP